MDGEVFPSVSCLEAMHQHQSVYSIWGFHKYRYPNSWMVYFMENPNLKWMMTGGTPILGNLQMVNNMVDIYIYNDILSIMRHYDI